MKKFITLILVMAASFANAQSSSKTMLDLEPNIIAAANCNGALFAVSMANFQNGVLNEQRARVMLRTTTLAFWLMATKHQSVQHLMQYADDYDSFFTDSYGLHKGETPLENYRLMLNIHFGTSVELTNFIIKMDRIQSNLWFD